MGDLVAVRGDAVEDTPWIGRVTKFEGDNVQLVWMEGGYEKQWTVMKVKAKRGNIEWKDSVPKCSIILYGFELTKGHKLRKSTVDALKSSYDQYYN